MSIPLQVASLSGIMKLGQNKNLIDMTCAGENLIAHGDTATGKAMLASAAARTGEKS